MAASRFPTKGKFIQYNDSGTEDLEEWRKQFVAIADPTEYNAAITLAGSWAEWQRIKREWPEFRDRILIEWLAEVEVKLRSEAISNLCQQSLDPKGAAAAKWIAEGSYTPPTTINTSTVHLTNAEMRKIQREKKILMMKF